MSEQVSNGLPLSWSWSRFSTVAHIASNLVDPGVFQEMPHVAPNNIERDTGRLLPYNTIRQDGVTSGKHLFHVGQILYSKIRPYLNKCTIARFDGLCSADMYPVDARIDASYLHHYMLTRRFVGAVSEAAGSRTVLPKTNVKQMAGVSVPVAPLPEQLRIVAEIETQFTRLDAAVATLKRVQANLKRARASVLKAAVEGRLVPTEAELARTEGRSYEPASVLLDRILEERRRKHDEAQVGAKRKKKYKPPVEPDTEGLPELPEGWVWASPDAIARDARHSLAIGPFGSNLRVPDYRDQGVPLVFVRNVRSGVFADDGGKFVDEAKATELRAHRCSPGDVLITKMGDPPGDSWVYPSGRPIAVVTADVVKWTVDPSLGQPWFFAFATRAFSVREQVLQRTKGVAQKKISLGRFKSIAYPVPPVTEQTRIAAEIDRRYSVLDAVEQAAERSLLRCTRLRQSILKRAFEGKLVPQDPNDEPASELLARIQAASA